MPLLLLHALRSLELKARHSACPLHSRELGESHVMGDYAAAGGAARILVADFAA